MVWSGLGFSLDTNLEPQLRARKTSFHFFRAQIQRLGPATGGTFGTKPNFDRCHSSTFNDIQRQVCASTFQTMLLGCVSLPCPRPWPSGWQPSSQHSSSFCREPPPSVSSAARGTQLAAGLTNKEMPGVMCQVSGACLPPHTHRRNSASKHFANPLPKEAILALTSSTRRRRGKGKTYKGAVRGERYQTRDAAPECCARVVRVAHKGGDLREEVEEGGEDHYV